MNKPKALIMAEMHARRKAAGLKRVGFWLTEEDAKTVAFLLTEADTKAAENYIEKIKKWSKSLGIE